MSSLSLSPTRSGECYKLPSVGLGQSVGYPSAFECNVTNGQYMKTNFPLKILLKWLHRKHSDYISNISDYMLFKADVKLILKIVSVVSHGNTSLAPTNHSSSQKTRLNDFSYGMKICAELFSVLSQSTRLTDRQTDGQHGQLSSG